MNKKIKEEKNRTDILFGLATYREKDWERLREISSDKDKMNKTYKSWKKEYNKLKKYLQENGIKTIKVLVDIDELIDYCKRNGLENNAKARAKFVAEKVRLIQINKNKIREDK